VVALILSPGFEEMEAVVVIDLLRRAGDLSQVTVFGLNELSVTGNHGITIVADALLSDMDSSKYDTLVLPGGEPGVTNMENDPRVIDLIQEFRRDSKLIGAICAAPRLLERAGILEDCFVSAHPSQKDFFKQGEYKPDSEVTNNFNRIVTAKAAGQVFYFAMELIRIIYDGSMDQVLDIVDAIHFTT
jgi:4-methyl-5(b-hydroxyethyl)-thiazole monophosphate biosynthesis